MPPPLCGRVPALSVAASRIAALRPRSRRLAPASVQNESDEITSPAARVIKPCSTGSDTLLRMNRTAPSQKRALNPPLECPPRPSSIAFSFSGFWLAVEREFALGLRPGHRLLRLDDQDRVRRAVHDIGDCNTAAAPSDQTSCPAPQTRDKTSDPAPEPLIRRSRTRPASPRSVPCCGGCPTARPGGIS